MSCTGTRYATAEDYTKMFCGDWPEDSATMIDRIERALDMSAGKIDLALASVAACDCTLSVSGQRALAYLNCLLAVVHYTCPCNTVDIDDDMRRLYAEEAQGMIDALMDGTLEVCEGETGSNFPSAAFPQIAWNDANAAEIYNNSLKRN